MGNKRTRKMTVLQEMWSKGDAGCGASSGLTAKSQVRAYTKAMTEYSPVTAIKAMCHACNGYEDAHKRTEECKIETCPLWPYRPGNSEWPKTRRVGNFSTDAPSSRNSDGKSDG